MNYWEECIRIAFNDEGVVATEEQILNVAGAVEGAHENYGMYSGNDSNYVGSRESEIRDLKIELKKEQDKRTCEACQGKGGFGFSRGYWTTQCHKCKGEGRC